MKLNDFCKTTLLGCGRSKSNLKSLWHQSQRPCPSSYNNCISLGISNVLWTMAMKLEYLHNFPREPLRNKAYRTSKVRIISQWLSVLIRRRYVQVVRPISIPIRGSKFQPKDNDMRFTMDYPGKIISQYLHGCGITNPKVPQIYDCLPLCDLTFSNWQLPKPCPKVTLPYKSSLLKFRVF